MGVAQYNASQDIKTTRKYFVGTTALRKGQILHYVENATLAESDTSAPDVKNRRGNAVEVPTTENLAYFAGVVSDSDAGKTGPCFVELLQPQQGDVLEVEGDGTTDITAGDICQPNVSAGCLVNGSEALGDVLFRALETDATNNTNNARTPIWFYKL